MEMLKTERSYESALEGYAKYRRFRQKFIEYLENDGIICMAEAPELIAFLDDLGEQRRQTIKEALDAYLRDRAMDAGRRGAGFSWSPYQARLMAEVNLMPSVVPDNVTELFGDQGIAD